MVQELGVGKGGYWEETGTGFLFRVMKMFWNWMEVMVAQHYECTTCH